MNAVSVSVLVLQAVDTGFIAALVIIVYRRKKGKENGKQGS